MGKTRSAIKDLDVVLKLKPTYTAARKTRAENLVKQGLFSAARKDYQELASDPGTAQALASITAAQEAIEDGRAAMGENEFEEALRHFNVAVEVASSHASLRLDRARCLKAVGQNGEAVGDAMRASKLQSANTDAFFLLAELYYLVRPWSRARVGLEGP